MFKVSSGKRQTKEEVERAPIELAIVLDRSGSMSGDKLNQAIEAIKQVIDALNDKDRLHCIVFDNKIEVVFLNGDLNNKESLKAKVQGISANGSTFLSGGLATGALALGCREEGKYFNRKAAADMGFMMDVPREVEGPQLKRVFLFSDGEANVGYKSKEELSQLAAEVCLAGATVSTFGIGRDFKEDIMTAIAAKGHGFYTYVKKSKLIPGYVNEALGNLKMLLGTNATLSVRGKGTCIVKRIFDHASNVAVLKDIREENVVQIVAEIQVMASDVIPAQDEDSIVEWTLQFTPSEGKREPVIISGEVRASFTRDQAKSTERNPIAASAVLQLQTGEMDDEVLKLLDSGNRKEAIEKKKKLISLLEEACKLNPDGFAPKMLKAQEKTLKQMESARSDNKVRKAVQYGGYLQRRASITAMEQVDGYLVESDSSSEEEDQPKQAPVRRSSIGRRRPSITTPVNQTIDDDDFFKN